MPKLLAPGVLPNHSEYWVAPVTGAQVNVTELLVNVVPGTGVTMWKVASV